MCRDSNACTARGEVCSHACSTPRVGAGPRQFFCELTTMVLLEMSITPLGKGESVSAYVAECVDIIDRSGLDYELHAMGTIVEGELDQVLDLMRRCIEQTATHSDRV